MIPVRFTGSAALPANRPALQGPPVVLRPDALTFGACAGQRPVYKLGLLKTIGLTRKPSPWEAQTRALVEQYEQRNLRQQLPGVGRILDNFGDLPASSGIPPALNRWDPENPKIRLKSTNGALAIIALDILKQLPPAPTADLAFIQIKDVLSQISEKAVARGKTLGGPWKPSNGLQLGFFRAKGLERTVYSQILTGHILAVGANGAVQILKVPSPGELVEIIANDPKAQKAIARQKPVKPDRFGFFRMPSFKPGFNLAQTLQYLREMAAGQHRERTVNGWSDVHTLLRDIPFNFARHIREGRVQVLFEKPGADGGSIIHPPL